MRGDTRCGLAVRMLAALALVVGIAAWATAAESGVRVQVAGDERSIVLTYTFGPYELRPVTIGGETYVAPFMAREAVSLVAGEPALPHVNRSLVIPADAEMGVRVLSAQFHDVSARVSPSKGNLYRTVDPATVPYTFADVYSQDAFVPAELATLHEPYVMRDLRGQVIEVQPFQYNPVTQTLRIYSEMTVEVFAAAPRAAAADAAAVRPLSRAFDDLYSTHFVNYRRPERYGPLNESGGMLIICHDPWIPNMMPLVAHKNAIGVPTTIVGISSVGNVTTLIKNYIQVEYQTRQGGLSFVLLVGDQAQIASPSAWGGLADPLYAKITPDNYPDLIVGRFSAETAAQVDTQVQRTLAYEQQPATQQPWFWKGIGIASAEGAGVGDDGQADFEHMAAIRSQLLGAGYTWVDELYATNGANAAQVTAALNAGRGVINYCGHGSEYSWATTGFSNAYINALDNAGKLPFIFSVACVNGAFGGRTCFAEAWLRATHNGQPSGAIGAYMATINQSWAPPMEGQDEFNTRLAAGTYHSLGALCYAGGCATMDKYGSAGVEMYDTWHLFGDPSLRVVGSSPAPCPGDTDGNRVVNQDDLDVLLFYFGQSVSPGTNGDLDGNGVVNQDDMDLVLFYFGTNC